jgi:hypothetical protein
MKTYVFNRACKKVSGGNLMTEDDKDEIQESQKLSKRDKREIEEGACVNCAIASIIVTILLIFAMVL